MMWDYYEWNPYRRRTAIQLRNLIATDDRLLAALFIVLSHAKINHIKFFLYVLGLFFLIYDTIFVPMGTGFISKKYIIWTLRKILTFILDKDKWNYYITRLTYIASWLHLIFVEIEGVHLFLMQLIFNMGAEKLLCPDQQLSCLYVLVFCIYGNYLSKSLWDKRWCLIYAFPTTRRGLILVIPTLICTLLHEIIVSLAVLIFTMQFNNLEPGFSFVCLTLVFFILTQHENSFWFRNFAFEFLSRRELYFFEGMEKYWIPVLTSWLSIGFSATILIVLIFTTSNYITMIMLGYMNIFVPAYQYLIPALEELYDQLGDIAKYQRATWADPQIREKCPCPICLNKLQVLSSRRTPCGHIFHGACLRRSLEFSKSCPYCRTGFS